MSSTLLIALALAVAPPTAEGWKAGTAKVAITPREPSPMAGSTARVGLSTGKTHDLWVKVLALEDPVGERAVLITVDLAMIGPDIANPVRDALKAELGLDRSRVVIACSTTVSGPVAGRSWLAIGLDDPARTAQIEAYAEALRASIGRTVADAFDDLDSAILSYGTGRADFAVNVAANLEDDVPALREALGLEGPVDHDVPVLRVDDLEGGLVAVVFGYACQNAAAESDRFQGDYAGFAMLGLEKAHPGTQAMFVAGPTLDQAPVPRGAIDRAQVYAGMLTQAVEDVLDGLMRPINGAIGAGYEDVRLRFAATPTREALDLETRSADPTVARRARLLLARLAAGGAIEPTYPAPVVAWRLGDLEWVFLGGEPDVEYGLRIKRNLGSSRTWVSAACGDVFGPIPTARSIRDADHDRGGMITARGLAGPWDESIEAEILAAVARVVRASATAPVQAPGR